MASVIGPIREHIVEAIETTSIVDCTDAYKSKRTKPPQAFIGWELGVPSHDPNGTLTTRYPFTVEVTGSSVEQVDLACEEISILWYTAARLTVLNGKGGTMLYPEAIHLAQGKEGGKDFIGYVDMFVETRRTT